MKHITHEKINISFNRSNRMIPAIICHDLPMDILSSSSIMLLEKCNTDEFFTYIADSIRSIIKEGITIVSEYEQQGNTLIVKAISGDENEIKIVNSVLKQMLIDTGFTITEESKKDLGKGNLVALTGGIHELLFGQLSESICTELEDALQLEYIYAISFTHDKKDLLGTILILSKTPLRDQSVELVEAFTHQAAIALRVRKTTIDLQKAQTRYRDLFEKTEDSKMKAEDALRGSEQLYRSMIETTHEGVWIINQEKQIVYVNRRMGEMLGYEGHEMLGKHLADFSDERTKVHLTNNMPERRKRGVREKKLLKSDGTYLWVLESANQMTSESGAITGILGMVTDITVRKDAEAAIERARAEMEKRVELRTAELWKSNRLLTEEIAERIQAEEALFQRQRALESVYSIATSFGGSLETSCDQVMLSLATILDTTCTAVYRSVKGRFKLLSLYFENDFIHEGLLQVSQYPFTIAIKDTVAYQCMGEFCGPTLSENLQNQIFTTFLSVPVMKNDGEVIGIITIHDIKKRHYNDYEIHLIEIFARYIAHEIERDLMEEQLRHSREMNVLGQLASGVAHEVRNPLNGILSITEALFQDLGDVEEYKPYLHHIRLQTDRLSLLMQDLLDLGNPIRETSMHPIITQELCSEAIALWEASTKFRSHKVVISADSEPLQIMGDSPKLHQVIINILENAAQHSTENFRISLNICIKEEVFVHISIIDNGTGIPLDYIPKIFDPFFTTRKKGYGLGLSIVKHITESHGGEISIRNNSDCAGCTADILFPIYKP